MNDKLISLFCLIYIAWELLGLITSFPLLTNKEYFLKEVEKRWDGFCKDTTKTMETLHRDNPNLPKGAYGAVISSVNLITKLTLIASKVISLIAVNYALAQLAGVSIIFYIIFLIYGLIILKHITDVITADLCKKEFYTNFNLGFNIVEIISSVLVYGISIFILLTH